MRRRLAHIPDHIEEREVHREQYGHYKTAHEYQDDRFDKRGDLSEPNIDLRVIEVRHFIKHFSKRSGPFAYDDHVDRKLADLTRFFEAFRKLSSFPAPFQNSGSRLSQAEIRNS